MYGQGNCSWKEGHDFATSRYMYQENYWDMDAGIKRDIWSVMEDFAKAPGGKATSDVCGCCGIQTGDSVIYNLSLYTY